MASDFTIHRATGIRAEPRSNEGAKWIKIYITTTDGNHEITIFPDGQSRSELMRIFGELTQANEAHAAQPAPVVAGTFG